MELPIWMVPSILDEGMTFKREAIVQIYQEVAHSQEVVGVVLVAADYLSPAVPLVLLILEEEEAMTCKREGTVQTFPVVAHSLVMGAAVLAAEASLALAVLLT